MTPKRCAEPNAHRGADSKAPSTCGPTVLGIACDPHAGPGEMVVVDSLACSEEMKIFAAWSRVLLPKPKMGAEARTLTTCGPSVERTKPPGESMTKSQGGVHGPLDGQARTSHEEKNAKKKDDAQRETQFVVRRHDFGGNNYFSVSRARRTYCKTIVKFFKISTSTPIVKWGVLSC